MPSEAQALITINNLLVAAGWRFIPDGQGRRENVVCEHRVSEKVFSPHADPGNDHEMAAAKSRKNRFLLEMATGMGKTLFSAAFKLPPTGPIGLEGDRGQMEYRRIRIQELP